MEYWWNDVDIGEHGFWKKNVPQCTFIYYETHM
jgi:hypothetical protein